MKIAITGCAGFIGSHAVDEFLDSGHEVLGIDKLTYAGDLRNLSLALKSDRFSFFRSDISDTDKIRSVFSKFEPEWVINFAAETHVDNSIKSIEEFIHSNVVGVARLLDSIKGTSTNFFQISTDEVYGDTKSGKFKENDNLAPKNPYSATKASAEHLVIAHHNTFGTQYLIARPSNNFGPRQNLEKFMPKAINCLLDGKKIPVYGDGSNIREWTYVLDTVRAIRFLTECGKKNDTYNISSEYQQSNLKTVESLCKEVNVSLDHSFEFVPDRPGHDWRYSISSEKLRSIGFSIDSNFNQSLRDTIEWVRINKR